MLTKEEKIRYSRHLMLEDVGETGQEKLKNAKVLVIGCGALGSPNLLYLAGAGIGTLGIVDDDCVELSNLHRQIIFQMDDIGKPKAECAKQRILNINPEIQVKTYLIRMTAENAQTLIQDYDFVIDATDNFVSKFLINDACILANKPFVHAGIMRYCGQLMSVIPHKSACLSCIFPHPPTQMQLYKNGLFATITGTLGSISSNEVLKFFTGTGTLLTNAILSLNLASMQFTTLQITRNPNCPICGNNASKQIRHITCY